jgi:acyl-CoA synthetase (AMP-forming)/AMP-acid ligase II
VYASGLVGDAVAVGAPHAALGEAIVLVCSPPAEGSAETRRGEDLAAALLAHCKGQMPGFMVPQRIEWLDSLPRNPNGKFDRPALAARYRGTFEAQS